MSARPRNPFNRRATLCAVVAASALGGCMVGPDYERPDAALNEQWLSPTGAAPEATIDDAPWWEHFNDPALTALIHEAYEQNLTLRIAGLRVLEARAARGIAVGQFFPQTQEVFGGVDATQLSDNEFLPGGDGSFSTARIGIQAAWELDFWGRFRRGIEAANAELEFTVADYDAVLVALAAEVATNYILIRSLEERLTFARSNVQLQSETLDLTRIRFEAGAVSELDVSTARATLANTQALVPTLENALRQSKLSLGILLGRTPSELEDALTSVGAEAARVPVAPPSIAAGIPADLLRRRPDVRAAERLAAAQSARIGVATADLFPSVSIAGSTGFISSDLVGGDLGDLFDADSFAGFIGLQVNWPILNYGRIQNNIRVQDARFEQAIAAYQESVLRAAADVEAGLSDFLRAREQSAFLLEAVDASQRSVDLSLIQYRSGAVDFIRVNIAQTDLVEQQDNLVSAQAAIALGAVRTYRALGGGWELRAGREFVDEPTADRMRDRTNWGDILRPDWDDGADLGFQRPDTPGAPPGEDQ
ncbi:MAG: efflux transporter outer membrane subunit [Planctomycetota bacterium]|nr:efflux transporter outer membrane subunit [Planctomycetota bacterium]